MYYGKEDIGLELQTCTYLGVRYGMFEIDSPYNIDEQCAVVNLDTDEIIGYTYELSLYDYLVSKYGDI